MNQLALAAAYAEKRRREIEARKAVERIRRVPFPEFEPERRGDSWCVWCGFRVWHHSGKRKGEPNKRSHWHKDCLYDFRLHSRLEEQRDFVIERDGERCGNCGDAPMKWLRGPIITVYRQTPGFGHVAKVGTDEWLTLVSAWRRENPSPQYQDIDRVSALELDHRIPLWSVADLPDDERRRFFGPENLWMLCPACHKAKSRREAAQRAALKRAAIAAPA